MTEYRDLLQHFWKMHSPYAGARTQYRSAVWYHSDEQKAAIESVRDELASSKQGLFGLGGGGSYKHTAVEPAGAFYRAEEYHQNWVSKNELH